MKDINVKVESVYGADPADPKFYLVEVENIATGFVATSYCDRWSLDAAITEARIHAQGHRPATEDEMRDTVPLIKNLDHHYSVRSVLDHFAKEYPKTYKHIGEKNGIN